MTRGARVPCRRARATGQRRWCRQGLCLRSAPCLVRARGREGDGDGRVSRSLTRAARKLAVPWWNWYRLGFVCAPVGAGLGIIHGTVETYGRLSGHVDNGLPPIMPGYKNDGVPYFVKHILSSRKRSPVQGEHLGGGVPVNWAEMLMKTDAPPVPRGGSLAAPPHDGRH